MKHIILLVLVLSSVALAGDFASRVAEGRNVMKSPEGAAYDKSLLSVIRMAMLTCVPRGSTGHLGEFALVGTISADGVVSAIDVQPQTDTSTCFAKEIAHATLPKPPSSPYPLTIEMAVKP